MLVNTAADFARGYPPRADGKWILSIAGARLGRYSAFRFLFLFLFLACYHDVPYFFLAFASCICPRICLSTFCIVFLRFFDLAKSSSISTTPTFHRDPETRCCSTLRPRHMEFNIRAAHSDGKVRFSSVQRLFCPNPEPEHWFGSAISLNPELNPWFRFKGFSSGSGRV